MDQTKLDLLDSHKWEDTIVLLTAYVINLCKFHRYRLPAQTEPEDIVMDAIDKVYAEDRNWDPEKDPDLNRFMHSVVKSMLSNTMTARQTVMTELDDSVVVSNEPDAEYELRFEELNNRISASVSNDSALALVYKALKDGMRPKEITEEYTLEIRIVRNAQKRLRSLVAGLIDRT